MRRIDDPRKKASGQLSAVEKSPQQVMESMAGTVSAANTGRAEPSTIVGIGASAGGLEAFTELLRHLPVNTGMGFVLIQHLDPSHESFLPALLSKVTPMPVTSVQDGAPVRPNEVYVMPPNHTVTIAQGVLQLQLRLVKSDHRPIDEFFRSLGEDQRDHAVGVVLSGTGSDGTLGLEWIKAEGGITFAQDESARYDGMPQNAIAAGHVDFVLPPNKIADEIAHISRHPYVLAAEITAPAATEPSVKSETAEDSYYDEILQLVRKATGVDFANYRANTIRRRIVRRIVLHKLDGMSSYVSYIREHPAEAGVLLLDLLIGVTSFFRNAEAFDALKAQVFPSLLKRDEHETLRFWIYGCSTGQEAYSLAMTFLEFAGDRRHAPIQIYATDLNELAIDRARSGLYPKSIVHDISPERLRRFFVETEAGYQMNKTIREMCVFARQDLLTDPPFSKIDLISCRNVLIYMEPALQKKIIPMFHYALKPNGFLLLGLSETVGTDTDLFGVLDKKHKIYAKKQVLPRANFGKTTSQTISQRVISLGAGERPKASPEFDPHKEADRILLTKYAPASVLVDGRLEIVQVRGSTGPYLEAPTGRPTHNLLRMAREDLVMPIRAAIRQAKSEDRRVQAPPLYLKHNSQSEEIRLEVTPVHGDAAQEPYFLIVFHSDIRPADSEAEPCWKNGRTPQPKPAGESTFEDLKQQLEAARQYSQSLAEQQEAYNEELQSANEEVQSSNEELQSINEELETAKEELQSGNEELITTNEELQNRNQETHQLNTDLTNLLTNIRMPVIMVDGDLRIRRFTPAAAKTLNLRDTDIGRSLADLRLDIEIPNLTRLLIEVIDNVSVREQEVQDRQGRWYRAYFGPYMTAENRVDGAVIVLTDIHALKEIEHSLMGMRDYANAIVETVRQPLIILGPDLRVLRANESFYEMFHVSPKELEGRFIYEVGDRQWNLPELRKLLEEVLPSDGHFQGFEVQQDSPVIGPRNVLLNARRLLQKESQEPMILMGFEDITYRKLADAARDVLLEEEKAARCEAEELARIKDEFLATVSHELRTPLSAILGWARLLNRDMVKESDRKRALESIERNAKIQATLVEDLMDASRMVAGKVRLNFQEVDLAAVVDAVLDTVRPTASVKRIQIVFSCEAGTASILGDPQRLEQVMWNLLMNAVKFTPPEGRIEVRLQRMDSGAEIKVMDNGRGVKAELMPYIFQRFRQGDSSSTRSQGGLGLGLAIVRHLVEMHGGTVWAESEGEGQGSTFIVQFPIRAIRPAGRASDLSSPNMIDQTGRMAGSLENTGVLVVDDEGDTRNVLTSVLEHYGAQVRTAVSVAEALSVLADWKPAVIVSDIAMPERDGYELIREVRKLSPQQGGEIPAVALTAYGKEADRLRALEAGYQVHLIKPTNPLELMSIVSSLATKRGEETGKSKGMPNR